MKFGGQFGCVTRKKLFDFGEDLILDLVLTPLPNFCLIWNEVLGSLCDRAALVGESSQSVSQSVNTSFIIS